MFDDTLGSHDSLTAKFDAAAPVPVRVSTAVAGCASLVKVSVALAAPETCGLKVTLKDVLSPAWIFTGRESPPTLNAELFVLAPVIVIFAPLALRVPDATPLFPTTTLPKLLLPGLTVSCPREEVAEHVPESARLVRGFGASLLIASVPLNAPDAVGAKTTPIVVLCPAARVTGRLGSVREKYLLEIAAALMVIEAVPEFVAVTVRVLRLPGATPPKSRLALSKERPG
jgi:hypothetical protein